jgi:Fe-S cluster assembly iron-binding protein IscA
VLTVTRAAAEVLDSMVATSPETDGAGVRISRTAGQDGEAALSLAPAPSPQPEDAVLDGGAEHASVFIEPEASVLLEGMVLDARVENDQVGLVLAQRPS